MHAYFELIKRLHIRRKYCLLLLLRSPFDVIRAWMQAALMRSVFSCLETESADRLPAVCIGWGLLCALLFLYNGTVWSVYAVFAAETEARLQKDMTDKTLSLPYRLVQGRLGGEWFTRRNGDIQAAIAMMNGPLNIPHLVTACFNMILSSFLMLRASPALLAVTWAFILPYLLVNYRIVLKPLNGLKERSRSAMADISSSIKPLIADAEAILLYDAGSLLLEKCEQESRRLMRTNLQIQTRRGLSDMTSRLFGIGGYLALLLTGFSMIAGGKMALSGLLYCSQLRGSILASVLMLVTCRSNIKANAVCVKKVNEALEE